MWWISLIIIFIIILVIGIILLIIFYHLHYWRFKQIPHESPKQISELIRDIAIYAGTTAVETEQEHYKQLYLRFKKTGAKFCGFYHFLQPRVLVLDLELAKQILIKDFSNFNSRGIYYNNRDDPLSADLWSRSGNSWKNMRLKLEPIFEKEQMRNHFLCVYAECEKLLNEIKMALKYQEHSVLLDMKRLFKCYVLSTIATCVFGLNTEILQKKYPLNEFEAATELLLNTHRHDIVLNTMLTSFPKLARKLHFSTTNRKVSNYFITLIEDVVAEREQMQQDTSKYDYLQVLINIKKRELATHEVDDNIDAKQLKKLLSNELIADIIGFLKSGYKATVNTLYYAIYELAVNEWAQNRARQEIFDAIERHNNVLCYDAVEELTFLEDVIAETLRRNPIAPYLIRCTLNDYHVPSERKSVIRKNMYVIIPTHAMHNDAENIENPDQFNPERPSVKQQNENREKLFWLGFGEGPRCCIGIQFAQLQMRIAIASILQRYKITLNASNHMPANDLAFSMKVEPLMARDSVESTETDVLI